MVCLERVIKSKSDDLIHLEVANGILSFMRGMWQWKNSNVLRKSSLFIRPPSPDEETNGQNYYRDQRNEWDDNSDNDSVQGLLFF